MRPQRSSATQVVPEGTPFAADGRNAETELATAGPQYFQTMGVPVVAGRDFDERDTSGTAPVAILTEVEARRLFGSAQAALGRRVRSSESDDGKSPPLEIVGVVRDKRNGGAEGEPRLLFLSLLQQPDGGTTIVVRSTAPGALFRNERAVSARVTRTECGLPERTSEEASRTSERVGGLGAKPPDQ